MHTSTLQRCRFVPTAVACGVGRQGKHCIALHCIALHCIALHCIALHCIALLIALHYSLHCIALHCIALHCIALLIALHCIGLDWIALHYSKRVFVSQFALVIIRSTLSKPSAHTTNDIQRKQRYTIWNIRNIPDSVEHTT
jgi:hypothetical protein